MIGTLADLLPAPPATVVVDGAGSDLVAERLASRGVTVTTGPSWRETPPDALVWLRDAPHGSDPAEADVVVDLHDPRWPVIRRVRADPAGHWRLRESRAFFATRAATWDTRFGDDIPAYTAAVSEAGLRAGDVAIDVGCGTGRALPVLRSAVGRDGRVLGLDLTPEMLEVAASRAAEVDAALLQADASHLPLRDATVDAVLAAGLVAHLPDPTAGLRELARVTRPGGRLIVFHPTGRAALAARHGREVRADEPLSEGPLRESTQASGWHLDTYDDAPTRFLALARRA